MPGLPFNIDDLTNLCSIEGNRVEFKATWDSRVKSDVIRSVSAFANDLLNMNGGYIILGIEEKDGRPILPPRGLDACDMDNIQRTLTGECKGKISPEYLPVLFPEIYQNRPILVIWAPGGDNRPYQAPSRNDEKTRAFHVRHGSSTIEARGDLLRQLLEMTAKVPFDDRRALGATIADISPSHVHRFLENVRSDLVSASPPIPADELYRKLRITTRINDHEVPRNVGLICFSDDPDRFLRGARIEIAHFSDDAGGNLIEEKTIKGPA
ncbi:MAG: ATP-binding protein [Candidatus Coatesbacteria bacterium]|nr:ATP-binding protein [Candidatus Coatesbacteria bacterium]